MILLLYNLFYMFNTYGLHPNFVFTKYGRDNLARQGASMSILAHHVYATDDYSTLNWKRIK
jgi:hypothetical protein